VRWARALDPLQTEHQPVVGGLHAVVQTGVGAAGLPAGEAQDETPVFGRRGSGGKLTFTHPDHRGGEGRIGRNALAAGGRVLEGAPDGVLAQGESEGRGLERDVRRRRGQGQTEQGHDKTEWSTHGRAPAFGRR